MGLMDYRARFYDHTIARFVQPDPIVSNPTDPQAFNRFSYVQNRPIAWIDPSGHMVMCGIDGADCDDNATDTNDATLGGLNLEGYTPNEIEWLTKLYEEGGDRARHAVEYIISHGVHIEVGTGWQSDNGSRGAWFDEVRNVLVVNQDVESNFNANNLSLYALSLIIHEAAHLEQGGALSHSQLGEGQAWQIQADVLIHLGYFRLDENGNPVLGNAWGAVVHASTLEQFTGAVQTYWPGYWSNDIGIGLVTYSTTPSCYAPLGPCLKTPWYFNLNLPNPLNLLRGLLLPSGAGIIQGDM